VSLVPAPDASVLRQRRARLSRALDGEPVLLVGHDPAPRNFLANVYPFRQDSTFLYYLGCATPGAAAVVEDGRTTLYLPPVAADAALWEGEPPQPADLARRAGADAWLPADQLPARDYHALPSADPGATRRAEQHSGRTLLPRKPLEGGSERLAHAIIDQRLALDAWELASMREAMGVTAAAHVEAMRATRPGTTEYALHALIGAVFAAHGLRPAYQPIVTVRGEVLHGHAVERTVEAGQLVLVDAGAESAAGYASDVTRTWPVVDWDGRQRAAYELVLAANEASIAAVAPGVRYRDVHLTSARVLAAGLVDLGLLRGDVDGLVEQGAHAVFFPHGVGHLLGLDVHDMELLGDAAGYGPGRSRSEQFGLGYLRLDRDLAPGTVVTIEPGFYVVPAILRDEALRSRLGDAVDWATAEGWLGFGGIRVEDDVLVTADGHENLSAAIPKNADAVAALVGTGPSVEERLGLA
jgi:Xaa-Pro aminopeptidase